MTPDPDYYERDGGQGPQWLTLTRGPRLSRSIAERERTQYDAETVETVEAMFHNGYSNAEIVASIGMNRTTVSRIKKRLGLS